MRETKYNQHTNQRKAPIDREGLWTQISSDPKFPKPEPKNRKRFWIFGGLSVLLLLVATVIIWPIFTNNKTIKNKLSIDEQQVINTELSKSKSHSNQYEVTTPPNQINAKNQKDITEQSTLSDTNSANQKTATTKQKRTLINQPQRTPRVQKSKPNLGPQYNTVPNPNTPTESTSHFNSITSIQPNQTPKGSEVVQGTDKRNEDVAVNQKVIQTKLNSMVLIDPLDHSVDLPLSQKVKDYQNELSAVKSKIGLLAYANTSFGLSMHRVIVSPDTTEFDLLDSNVADYLTNRESRAIEIGLKKTVFKRYRIGFGAELRQDWQVYNKSTTSEVEAARDSMVIAAGFALQQTTTQYTLHQKYQSVNLNLSVDRIIPLGWAYLELGAGVGYQLGLTVEGRVLDIENTLIDRTENYPLYSEESSIQSRFSGFGQVGLTLPLNEDLRLSFNARYNISTELSSNTDRYSHSLSAVRLGVGLGYEF